MRTLLRDTVTGLYLQDMDKWTDALDRASDFRFTDRALNYVETWHLNRVELAFTFNDPEQVIAVAVGKAALQFTPVNVDCQTAWWQPRQSADTARACPREPPTPSSVLKKKNLTRQNDLI
jgi:hypothetical protein